MNCPKLSWIKKYGVECDYINGDFKCKNLEILKKKCNPCNYFHIIECHNKYFALPCMYPCSNDGTGLYNMCPHIKANGICYDYIRTIMF